MYRLLKTKTLHRINSNGAISGEVAVSLSIVVIAILGAASFYSEAMKEQAQLRRRWMAELALENTVDAIASLPANTLRNMINDECSITSTCPSTAIGDSTLFFSALMPAYSWLATFEDPTIIKDIKVRFQVWGPYPEIIPGFTEPIKSIIVPPPTVTPEASLDIYDIEIIAQGTFIRNLSTGAPNANEQTITWRKWVPHL